MSRVRLGSDDFERYQIENDIYVDKTLFIKELIDDRSEVLLMTRPRRFGKSLNISMVKHYFEKTLSDKSSLFKNLKIWKTDKKYLLEQGKYPVIFISIKEVEADDWEQCFTGLKAKISEVFESNSEIKFCLSKNEILKFEKIESGVANQKEFELSLLNLSKWLERYHGEKVMILIDEYDSPINCGYNMGYKEKIIGFMRTFLGAAMKSNISLKKAILTGVTRIAGESLFSGLNNFRSYSVLDEEYSEYFGFTEKETSWVLETCKVEHDFSEIKNWYDGYTFGNTCDIYNPWSIMNVAFSPKKMLHSYWVNSGSDKVIKDQLAKSNSDVKEIFYQMIKGEKLRLPIVDNVSYDDVINSTDGLWSFLLYAGYLTAEAIELGEIEKTASYFIPNKEVAQAMRFLISSWLTERAGTSVGVNNMLKEMLSSHMENFSDRLSRYVYRSFSYFDTTGMEPELVYHAFILGLLAHLDSRYYFNSNPEAGMGRADILIMPKVGNLEKNAVVLEFKKARKESELENKTQLALDQIKFKDYIEEAKKRGAETIYCYGIGFYKQEIMMKMETIEI